MTNSVLGRPPASPQVWHDKFWSNINYQGPINEKLGHCWEWIGNTTNQGYGRVWDQQRTRPSHVMVYEFIRGAVRLGLELDHLCRNRSCCNPDHLEAVTHKENTLRSPIAPAAINSRKETCAFGHPFEMKPATIKKRFCRICFRKNDRERKMRLRRAS